MNLRIFAPTPAKLAGILQVKVLDIKEGMSDALHPEGLYSEEIFGRVGSDERLNRFGYFDLKLSIFHPLVYRKLCQLRSVYDKILNSKAYAVWDDDAKDFTVVPADTPKAETGYSFFIRHWKKIDFTHNKSLTRDLRIALVTKYKNQAVTDKLLVMPAGMRDYDVDDSGRFIEDEINEYYRKVLATSFTLPSESSHAELPYYDNPRRSMQTGFNDIYDYISRTLYGKKGFIQHKWGRRRIMNGTRNVLSAMDTTAAVFDSPNSLTINDTLLGLYQTVKSILPKAIYSLRMFLAPNISDATTGYAQLIDPKTLKQTSVRLSIDSLDLWSTSEGLEQIINKFEKPYKRQKQVMIDGHFLALVYRDERHFRILRDIEELPEGWDQKRVRPITYTEMLYLCNYSGWYQHYTYVTRYPIAGLESMYPSRIYTKTTMRSTTLRELGPDWKPLEGDEFIAREYPSREPDAVFFDSMSPHPSREAGLAAD